MGLTPLDLHDWIEPDARMAVELAEKERLLRERHGDVFIALPEAAASAAEVLELLVSYLPDRFPTLYRRVGDQIENRVTRQQWQVTSHGLHPLDLAGRLVQEDLCLMQLDADTDQYRLVGASVCFPTRWRLAEKMGQSLGAIHLPVPDYAAQLDATMNRLFARLKVQRPVWRLNWSLIDNPALFQPSGHGRRDHNPTVTAHNAGDMLWLRVERQTLRRLPRTGDILFTIRIYVQLLRDVAANSERAAHLAAAMRALPPQMRGYKSLYPFMDAALQWLDPIAAEARTDDEDGVGESITPMA
jgi:hypothetical protein